MCGEVQNLIKLITLKEIRFVRGTKVSMSQVLGWGRGLRVCLLVKACCAVFG